MNNPVPGPVGFGKYPMSKWRDLPYDYLIFIVSSECHTEKANKDKARQEMENRESYPPFKRYL